MKLGRHGRLAARAVQGTRVPRAAETSRARCTSSGGRSRAGSRISSDQTYARVASDTGVRGASGRAHRAHEGVGVG